MNTSAGKEGGGAVFEGGVCVQVGVVVVVVSCICVCLGCLEVEGGHQGVESVM